MWIEPATVPPRKPSFEAVASSWIEPLTSAAELRGERNSLVQTSASATDMGSSPVAQEGYAPEDRRESAALPAAMRVRRGERLWLFAPPDAAAQADLLGEV